jgi:hypothetical protein
MTYHVSLNRDGADFNCGRAPDFSAAVAIAAQATGYTERTVRDYIHGRKPGWHHPADSYVLPVKNERNRDSVAVWIDVED